MTAMINVQKHLFYADYNVDTSINDTGENCFLSSPLFIVSDMPSFRQRRCQRS